MNVEFSIRKKQVFCALRWSSKNYYCENATSYNLILFSAFSSSSSFFISSFFLYSYIFLVYHHSMHSSSIKLTIDDDGFCFYFRFISDNFSSTSLQSNIIRDFSFFLLGCLMNFVNCFHLLMWWWCDDFVDIINSTNYSSNELPPTVNWPTNMFAAVNRWFIVYYYYSI